jgi:hypothetical protein
MPGELHRQLVTHGARWIKRQGFAVVATEQVTGGVDEQGDVVGFRSTCSVLLEAKASRADFLADARKPHRITGATGIGLGVYRFYICPPGVIEIQDLPPRWGLLHVVGKKVVEVLRPIGNIWSPLGTSDSEWARFQHVPDSEAERRVLFSIARRRSLSRSEAGYEKLLQAERQKASRLARENDQLTEKVAKLELALYLEKNGHRAELTDRGIQVQTAGEIRATIRRNLAKNVAKQE